MLMYTLRGAFVRSRNLKASADDRFKKKKPTCFTFPSLSEIDIFILKFGRVQQELFPRFVRERDFQFMVIAYGRCSRRWQFANCFKSAVYL